MKKIPLTNNGLTVGYALVDNEDHGWLSRSKWHLHYSGYAIRRVGNPGKVIWMHREVNRTPQGLMTDHVNRNRLDNRKTNLRDADRSLNGMNMKTRSDNTSGHKGVGWEKGKNRWMAYICIDGRLKKLGRFKDVTDAIAARKTAELAYFSDITRT